MGGESDDGFLSDGMVLNVEGTPRKEGTVAPQNIKFEIFNNCYCYSESGTLLVAAEKNLKDLILEVTFDGRQVTVVKQFD